MFRTIKRKLIFVFCVVSILFVCVSTGIFYKVFTNRLISTQQNNQNMLSQALCTSIEYFREKCETTINMLQEDEEIHSSVAQWLLFDDEETLQECLRKKVNEWDFINNILIMKTSYEYVGAKELDQILPYMVDRISTAERYGQNCVWDSGYGPNSSFVFRCFNVSEAEKNLYLFIQIANANFQSLFNRYRLQNDQRFSLKGITNGFEVTEQGFYYQYYDNYSQLVHTQIDIDDWQLKTWSEKTAARIVTKEFWVEMITIFLVLIMLIILLSYQNKLRNLLRRCKKSPDSIHLEHLTQKLVFMEKMKSLNSEMY